MSSTFSCLNIALSSLQTQKKAMETTGHNISNANTEGYTRQVVVQTASDAYTSAGISTGTDVGQTGTGVSVDEIKRITDEFINSQINQESQGQAYWEKISEGITQIESIFDDSSDSSLNDALDLFYESLQNLSSNPEDTATRKTVQTYAQVVADNFYALADNLLEYQSSLNEDLATSVKEINNLTSQIADLNKEIVSVKNSGQEANDLLDKRDLLLKELNTYIDVQSSEDNKGYLEITIDGNLLVSKDNSYDLNIEKSDRNQNLLVYSQTSKEIDINGGYLKGTIELRDEIVSSYLEEINTMAETFVNQFNEVHQQGYDLNGDKGEVFFTIDNQENPAMGINLSEEIEFNLNKIAAGRYSGTYSNDEDVVIVDISDSSLLTDGDQIEIIQLNSSTIQYTVTDAEGNVLQDIAGNNLSGTATEGDLIDLRNELGIQLNINGIGDANVSFDASVGNGENALELASIIDEKKLAELNNSTLSDYYQSIISSIGVQGEEAEAILDTQESLLEQLEEQQQSISGVSLDEEISNIIKYQQAYNAAANVVTTVDEMLDTLISMI